METSNINANMKYSSHPNFAINSSDCDSIFTDIQRSESKKISRLAQDLSSLGESLKQYLLLAKRKESGADSI